MCDAEGLIEKHNDLRYQASGIEKVLGRKFDLVRCPHNCFEQEPGNGSYEKMAPGGYGVVTCSICDGLGWVPRHVFDEYVEKYGTWIRTERRAR